MIFSFYSRREEKVIWFPRGELGVGAAATVLEGK